MRNSELNESLKQKGFFILAFWAAGANESFREVAICEPAQATSRFQKRIARLAKCCLASAVASLAFADKLTDAMCFASCLLPISGVACRQHPPPLTLIHSFAIDVRAIDVVPFLPPSFVPPVSFLPFQQSVQADLADSP